MKRKGSFLKRVESLANTNDQGLEGYWESEHSVIFEELVKCRKSQRQWKRKVEVIKA